MTLLEWAMRWKIAPEALRELCETAVHLQAANNTDGEDRVQSEIRLRAAQTGRYLFRNNRGAGKMESGNFVRYGLANDSKQLGERFKSADLIGWETLRIEQQHVGGIVARFLSVECKRRDWRQSNNAEEIAQIAWATLVNAQGGRAIITNSADAL